MRSYLKAWTEFEQLQKGRQASGVSRYLRTVKMFLTWLEGNDTPLTPAGISRADVDEFLKWLFFSAGNIKNSSRANKLSAIRSFFRYLVYARVISTDPTEGIPFPKISNALPQKFSTEELRLIFSSPDISNPMGLRDKAMLLTIYGAGLRVSEVCGLTISDITDTGGYIRLNILGKGNKNRVLTLRMRPSSLLRQWITYRTSQGAKTSDLVFVRLRGGNLEGLSSVSINDILKKYAARVGIKLSDVFVHKMRTTFATDLYDAGADKCPYCKHTIPRVDIVEIMHLMGHSDPKTTMRYIAVSDKVLRKTAIPDSRFKELETEKKGGDFAEQQR